MRQPITAYTRVFILALMLALMLVAAPLSTADMRLGIQGGWSGKDVDEQDFQHYALVLTRPLPWTWRITPDWFFSTAVSATAGVLTSTDEAGFIGSVGPWIALGRDRLPIQLTLGISPTVLSKRKFDDANFGSYLQFTSHIGVSFQLGDTWGLGYRFQHMSNASISDNNPGLNTHVVELNRRF